MTNPAFKSTVQVCARCGCGFLSVEEHPASCGCVERIDPDVAVLYQRILAVLAAGEALLPAAGSALQQIQQREVLRLQRRELELVVLKILVRSPGEPEYGQVVYQQGLDEFMRLYQRIALG